MKILIADDDLLSRKLLYNLLSQYGECDLVIDGLEALDAYLISLKENNPYDLVCLDIIMPKVDGVKVLKHIEDLETQMGILPDKRVKIIMTTALAQTQIMQNTFELGCDAYMAKPIDTAILIEVLQRFGLIK